MTQDSISIAEDPECPSVLNDIAKKYLGISTLETRNSGAQDFHDLAVWRIKAALAAAYEAGLRAQKA